MVLPTSYPFEAVAVKKYKSPHKNDLSFAKGDRIRITAAAPKDEEEGDEDDDEDDDVWLIGETIDGAKSGTFPASHVQEAPSGGADDVAAVATGLEGGATAAAMPSAADPAESREASQETSQAEAHDTGRHEPTHTPAVAEAAIKPDAASKGIETSETITEEAELEGVDKKLNEAAADPKEDVQKTAGPEAAALPAATTTSPQRKPSAGPPPAAPKPSGLAARIAAFNKPAEGPPPLPKGKPGAWKKPAAPVSTAPKPVATSPSSSTTEGGLDPSSTKESPSSKINTGFSAADAQSSIKMSLKERMAALQRSGNENKEAEGQEAKPRAPPKPAPGRISEDKRAAAMTSIGAEQVVSPRDEREELPAAIPAQKTGESMQSMGKDASRQSSTEDQESALVEGARTQAVEEGMGEASAEPADGGEEKTEEDTEVERRAAIAKRMAALGGRRMGGGPNMFGGSVPSGTSQRKATNESTEIEKSADAVALQSPTTEEGRQPEEEPTTSGQTLAVPRRTAPPRKKKSPSGSSSQASMDPYKQKSTDETSIPGDSAPSTEKPAIGNEAIKSTDQESVETAAVIDAGAGSILTDEEHMTQEPVSTSTEEKDAAQAAEREEPPTSIQRAPSLVEPPHHGDVEPTKDDRIGGGVPDDDEDDYMKLRAPSEKDADAFEPTTPMSERHMEENARQLEAFVHPETQDDAPAEPEEGVSAIEPLDETPTRSSLASPPPPSAAPPRPPSSRPPSARPPVPKTSVLGTEDEVSSIEAKRIASPPPSRAPPVPQATRRQASIEEGREGEPGLSTGQSLGAGAAARAGVTGAGVAASALSAPKARPAIPQELSDDEDDETDNAEQEESDAQQASKNNIVDTETSPQTEAQPGADPEEEDEEENERRRRRRLAERMAKMGGQPIMGAPMPFGRRPAALRPDEEPDVAEREDEEAADDVGGGQTADDAAAERAVLPPAEHRLASPPPVPIASPPPPMARREGSIHDDSLARRMSSSSGSVGRETHSMSPTGSMKARPPVPRTPAPAAGAAMVSADDGVEDGRAGVTAASPPPVPRAQAPQAPMSPAPRAPMSPPPRAPSSRPPVPPAEAIESQRRMSLVSQESLGRDEAAETAFASQTPIATEPVLPPSSSSGALQPVQPSAPSSRDLDLMPSSQWWRHGMPVKLPPTLLRPDALPSVSVQHDGGQHMIRVDLLFEDYSSTIVTVLFQDDDAAEKDTKLAQQHHFAPGRPSPQQLQQWSQQLGSIIAKQANALVASKTNAPILGDGTSRGFMSALVALATREQCLPPVGSSFGAIILAQAATTAVDTGADEIRPGDVVVLHGADLKGKRGLGSYHATFGTANDPTYACVLESESKKRKLRCILVGGPGSKNAGRPEEISLRLDDVRSGLLRVFRVAPRQGWLPGTI